MNNMVSLKCKNCGAMLTKSSSDKYVCEFCDSEYLIGRDVSTSDDYVVVSGILKGYTGSSIYVVIPDNVKVIGDGCFSNLKTVESVYIPDSVSEIGASAFENCSSLREISFSNSINEIGDCAFKNTGLKELILPESVKVVGRDAFMQCNDLEKVDLPTGHALKYERAFKQCSKLDVVNYNPDYFCKSLKPSTEAKKQGDTRPTYFDAFQATPFYNEIGNKIRSKKCVKCDGEIDIRGVCQSCGEKYVDFGGCYIATAVYGSYDCPQVWTLRRYRDEVLAKSYIGRCFISIYYKVSPFLVKVFGETRLFKNVWKRFLDRKVDKLKDSGLSSSE